MTQYPMTARGAEMLREELNQLKSVERPKIIASIAEAREHGDLKENAEYHAAREQQSFAEGRIQALEGKISNSQVIDITTITHTGKVLFGTTLNVIDVDTDEEKIFHIVGDDEADIKKNKISVNSPIARGLIGKMEGDVVAIDTPGGTKEYEIDRVQHI